MELIARVSPLEHSNMEVVYAQSDENVRDDGIISRNGVRVPAIKVASLAEITEDFDAIGVDEINMFKPENATIVAGWLACNKEVVVAGLDLDYRGLMMPIMKRLFELKPDEVIDKKAVCDCCKQYNAQFSQILHKGQLVLGELPSLVPEDGTYEYQARCREHFVRAPYVSMPDTSDILSSVAEYAEEDLILR